MDDLNLEKYGTVGALAAVAMPYIRMAYKKWVTGDWTSYGDLKKSDEAHTIKLNELSGTVNHISEDLQKVTKIQIDREVKEGLEDVVLEGMRRDIASVKNSEDLEHKHIFSQIETLFAKVDENHKEVVRILLEMSKNK